MAGCWASATVLFLALLISGLEGASSPTPSPSSPFPLPRSPPQPRSPTLGRSPPLVRSPTLPRSPPPPRRPPQPRSPSLARSPPLPRIPLPMRSPTSPHILPPLRSPSPARSPTPPRNPPPRRNPTPPRAPVSPRSPLQPRSPPKPRSPPAPPRSPLSPSPPVPSPPLPPFRPPPPPPPPPRRPALPGLPTQYYIHFGRCIQSLQKQQYGNWALLRPQREQIPGSLTLYLDTGNRPAVAPAFGQVDPLDFPIKHIYFAYFSKSAVKAMSPALEAAGYKETSSNYMITVNGNELVTVRDLKDQGKPTPNTAMYSLKGSLKTDLTKIAPSTEPYKIVISKNCETEDECTAIADPARVFRSPQGHVVWSAWSVDQPLTVNGVPAANHAWCPVQTAIDVD